MALTAPFQNEIALEKSHGFVWELTFGACGHFKFQVLV